VHPRDDDSVDVRPLVPPNTWEWFCLDNVRYHGRLLTVVWDRNGKHFGRGAGLTVFVDGKAVAHSDDLINLHAPLSP